VIKPLRKLAAGAMIGAGTCLVACIYAVSLSNQNATERDFIQYWAAGQQLAQGANPYDVGAILRLERAQGMEERFPKVTVSPPLGLFLLLPLGYLSPKTGLVLWLLLSLGCAGAAMWVLWLLNGRPDSRWQVLVFGFPPTLACLMAGQLGIFFLLEVSLFLLWHKSRPWLAGAALVLCALKPHLFLPAFLVLLLGSGARRNWRLVGGFLLALAACCVLSLGLDRNAWTQYGQMLQSARLMDVFIPTLSVAMRFALDRNARWLEFIPEIAACAWAVWYFVSRRERWEWEREGLLMLLVAAACSPYSWFTDQAMLFPAVLAGIYAAEKQVRAWVLLGAIAAGCLVGVIGEIPLPSAFYLWTAPAWLGWYLYATRETSAITPPAPIAQPSS